MIKGFKEVERKMWTGKGTQDLRNDNTVSFLGFPSISHGAEKGQVQDLASRGEAPAPAP